MHNRFSIVCLAHYCKVLRAGLGQTRVEHPRRLLALDTPYGPDYR